MTSHNSLKKFIFIFFILAIAGGLACYFLCKKEDVSLTTTKKVGDEIESVTNADISKICKADKSWFPHNQTPEPDNKGFASSSICEFHQWSWQMFLWLTQNDQSGNPRFLSFVTPESLLGMEHRGFMPRMKKNPKPKTFDEYLQAGSDAILTDHQGRAIYYSQYINQDFVDFINSNDLTDPTKVQGFNPETPFSIGSIELKASWKIVAEGEDMSGFFTMQTLVNKMVKKQGSIVIDPEQTESVTVALVGFHIGGIVNGHPEMIWATFEHKKNAPNVAAQFTPETIISDKDFLFYTAGTKYAACNVNVANTPNQKFDESTQILSPVTEICRQYEFGNDPTTPTNQIDNMKTNDNNIASLNKSVLLHLDPTAVWSNYHEVGAIWFEETNALKPNLSLATDDKLIGSLKLSNSTIETFTQTQSTVNNCFRCHNTLQRFPPEPSLAPLPALNINISHAFVNIYFWSQGLPKDAKEQ